MEALVRRRNSSYLEGKVKISSDQGGGLYLNPTLRTIQNNDDENLDLEIFS